MYSTNNKQNNSNDKVLGGGGDQWGFGLSKERERVLCDVAGMGHL